MAWERVIEEHPSATADGTDLMIQNRAIIAPSWVSQ
jgi:hypothetical protein